MARFLIVDDNEENLYMLGALLEGHGHKVESALNGAEALEIARRTPPDMIISDIMMPVMDGFTLCREARADDCLKGVPLVFYTATYTDDDDEHLALTLGADAYLRKPADPDELIEVIDRLTSGAEGGRAAVKVPSWTDQEQAFKLYSERLVRKLEQKNLRLEEEIAERRQQQERLQFLSSVVEQSSEGMAVANLAGDLLFVNEAWARMHGYVDPGALIGRNLAVFHNEEQLETVVAPFNQQVKEIGHHTGEVGHLRKDGTVFPTRMTTTLLRDAQGRPVALAGIACDITEQKRAQQALQQSEEQVRLLLDSTAEAIYSLDLEGNCTLCNPACLRLLGYERPADLLGKKMHELIHHSRVDGSKLPIEGCRVDEAFRRGAGTHVDDEVLWRADGTSFPAEYWSYPIRRGSQVIGAVVTFLDISERRKLEAQLRQAQKMEAIGQLTGGIAHDFNNVLTIIMSNAGLIASSFSQESGELRDEINELQAAAERGATMIRKLLGFARREKLQVDVQRLVNSFTKVVARLLPEYIKVQTVHGDGVSAFSCDPGAVDQILFNLATNARDAMPDGGTLRIETRPEHLDDGFHATHPWAVTGDYVCITVSDTGVGMDETTKDRIFEPFFTSKPRGEGTGLGMSMVYGLMKQHRGFVHVYSELGKGTHVKLYFPLADSDAARGAPALAPHRALLLGTESILVVEDEIAIRRATKRALESHGYKVLVAGDGEEALEIFAAHEGEIDLVMSDLVMPRLGGRQLLAALNAQGKYPRILFTSGYSAEEVKEGSAMDFRIPYLQKPWNLTDLLGLVRRALDE
jgi:PAS domain S-box-containing protein